MAEAPATIDATQADRVFAHPELKSRLGVGGQTSAAQFRAAWKLLDVREQQTLYERFREKNLTNQAVGDSQGVAESAIRYRVRQAMRVLRVALDTPHKWVGFRYPSALEVLTSSGLLGPANLNRKKVAELMEREDWQDVYNDQLRSWLGEHGHMR